MTRPRSISRFSSDRQLIGVEATTAEHRAHVERQLAALEQAETTTTHQRATLEQLTQSAAAWLIGFGSRHLRNLNAPRNTDGSYNASDLVTWHVDRVCRDAKSKWESESEDIQSAALRQAEARAIKLEEQAKALQDRYVEKDEIQRDLSIQFGRLDSRLSSLGTECAAIAPGELKSTVKGQVEERVRLALKELADGCTV